MLERATPQPNKPPTEPTEEIFLFGVKPWVDALRKIGVDKRLPPFNDVITRNAAPATASGYNLVLSNINLDGRICDIYHLDVDKNGQKVEKRKYRRA